jgi:hypothetical protein
MYHVHGLGYSFDESNSGKVIHFDIIPINGDDRIRFSVWKLHQYAISVGEAISEGSLASESEKLSANESDVVRVVDGPHEYYYYADSPPPCGN